MRVLVLTEDYSTPDDSISLHYVHSRNVWYLNAGIDVTVISFRARSDYVIDGISVYSLNSYVSNLSNVEFDILVMHAPNLKHHLKFLQKWSDLFKKIVFFFHGHEVLRKKETYPEPFPFVKKQSLFIELFQDPYDLFKLKVWKNLLPKYIEKSELVFVSHWMYSMFLKFVKIDPYLINKKKHIIYNCVGKDFETTSFDYRSEKKYDFITIRHAFDNSKYGIDIVWSIAESNPQYKFCVIGKGEFFNHYSKPQNLDWIDKNLLHDELIIYLNQAKCALMPTRLDAQGVMACEMATFGMPLITSDIDVCKEVFEGFENVEFIDNEDFNVDLQSMYEKVSRKNTVKNDKYFAKNTVLQEIQLFRSLTHNKG